MEPEHNIEKELRAYAQKRRMEAGTPPELHPATRKLLQDEAAKLSKSDAKELRREPRGFWKSWLRLAAAGCAVVALAAASWIFLSRPAGRRLETRQMPMMLAEKAKVPEPQKWSPPANQPALRSRPETAATAPSSSVAVAPAPAAPAPVAAPPPAGIPKTPAIVLAGKDAGIGINAATTGSFKSGASPAGPVPSAYAALDRSGATAGVLGEADVAPVIQGFRRTPLSERASKNDNPPGASNVLVSFQVEQTLGKLRMIDTDGSVYTGFVERIPQESEEAASNRNRATAKAADSITDGRKQRPAEERFRFRVIGTNRTLNEEVVFTGSFLSSATTARRALAASNELAAAAVASDATNAAGMLPLELRKATVAGRLLLDKTNQIEIFAVPVKP